MTASTRRHVSSSGTTRRNLLAVTALAAAGLIAGCSVDEVGGPSSTGGSGGTNGVAGAGGGADLKATGTSADAGADGAAVKR